MLIGELEKLNDASFEVGSYDVNAEVSSNHIEKVLSDSLMIIAAKHACYGFGAV